MNKYLSVYLLLVGLVGPERISAQVSSASQQNYNACMHGYSGCDQSRLTEEQKSQVQRAASQRNYNACLHGYYGCDQSRLTDVERTEVQQLVSCGTIEP